MAVAVVVPEMGAVATVRVGRAREKTAVARAKVDTAECRPEGSAAEVAMVAEAMAGAVVVKVSVE